MKKKNFKNLINEKKSDFRNLKCEFQKFNYEKKIYVRKWRNSVI